MPATLSDFQVGMMVQIVSCPNKQQVGRIFRVDNVTYEDVWDTDGYRYYPEQLKPLKTEEYLYTLLKSRGCWNRAAEMHPEIAQHVIREGLEALGQR